MDDDWRQIIGALGGVAVLLLAVWLFNRPVKVVPMRQRHVPPPPLPSPAPAPRSEWTPTKPLPPAGRPAPSPADAVPPLEVLAAQWEQSARRLLIDAETMHGVVSERRAAEHAATIFRSCAEGLRKSVGPAPQADEVGFQAQEGEPINDEHALTAHTNEWPLGAGLLLGLTDDSVALALHQAIVQTHPRAFVEDFSLDEAVIIDGRFHLKAVALMLSIRVHDLSAQALAPRVERPPKTGPQLA